MALDPAALESFYRRHVQHVTRFAARRCVNAADVADVVSATFVAAIAASARFDRRKGRPGAWLIGIAAHEVADLHRRSARQTDIAHRMAGRQLLDEADSERLAAQIDAETLAGALKLALDAAPRSERELFLLVALEELTPAEAARVLGISPVAARVRLLRARTRLRHVVEAAETQSDRTPRPSACRTTQEDG